jgi:phosphate-selective porin OprO and OprP
MKRFALAFGLSAALLTPATACAQDEWSATLSGRLVLDYAIADADTSDLNLRAGELRTARIGLEGENGPLAYELEFATDSTGTVSVTDAFINFEASKHWTFRAGQFRTPNSLDEQTSQRFTSFFERAAFTDAFEFDRRLGLGVFNAGDRHTFTAGVFAANLNDTALDEGVAAAARFTFQPVKTDTLETHLGASVRWREAGEDQPLYRYRQRAYVRDPGRIISTGSIADADTFVGVEGALIASKSTWIAAEYGTLSAETATTGAQLSGGYIEAGHVIGGERAYRKGKWDRPKVTKAVTEGGRGAFILTARYDMLDQTDGAIDGGTLDTLLLGAEWYATKQAKIGINLFRSDADFGSTNSGLGPAFAAARTAGATGDEVTGAVIRLQADF